MVSSSTAATALPSNCYDGCSRRGVLRSECPLGTLGGSVPRCKYQNTKQSEIGFSAVMGDNSRAMRFEWRVG